MEIDTVRKEEMSRQPGQTIPGSLMSRLVEMASSPDGITQRQAMAAMKIDKISANSLCRDACKRGRLVRCEKRLGHMVRFFARREDAAAYWSKPRTPDMPNSRAIGRLHDVREPIKSAARNLAGPSITLGPAFPVRRKGEARDAPVTIINDTRVPVGDAIVPKHVFRAYGVASGHDPRYQVGPGEEVPIPLGSTLSGAQA